VVDLEPVVLAWGTAFSVSDVLFVAALVLGGSVLFSILTDVRQWTEDDPQAGLWELFRLRMGYEEWGVLLVLGAIVYIHLFV
jgi:hypothetical protein